MRVCERELGGEERGEKRERERETEREREGVFCVSVCVCERWGGGGSSLVV